MMTKKTVVISGASRGIGAEVARAVASADKRLVLLARSEGPLEELSDELNAHGCEAIWRSVDLCDEDAREAFTWEMLHTYGDSLDGLILSAGVAHAGDFLSKSMDDIELEMRLNYEAPLALIRSFLPTLLDQESGHIVAISSLTSLLPFPGHSTYSASKGALTSLMRSLAAEYVAHPVHLGVVLPGYTETDMTSELDSMLPAMSPDKVARAVVRNITHREIITIPGASNKLASLAFQLFPSLGNQALDKLGEYLVPSESQA